MQAERVPFATPRSPMGADLERGSPRSHDLEQAWSREGCQGKRFPIHEATEVGTTRCSNFKQQTAETGSWSAPVPASPISSFVDSGVETSNRNFSDGLFDDIGQYIGRQSAQPWYSDQLFQPQAKRSIAPDSTLYSSHRTRSTAVLSCPFQGCSKTDLKNQSALAKHLNQHSKPFICDEPGCEVQFGTSNDLERHRVSKHGLQQRCGSTVGFICAACDPGSQKWWPRKDNFRAHLRRKHSDQDEFRLLELSKRDRRPNGESASKKGLKESAYQSFEEHELQHYSYHSAGRDSEIDLSILHSTKPRDEAPHHGPDYAQAEPADQEGSGDGNMRGNTTGEGDALKTSGASGGRACATTQPTSDPGQNSDKHTFKRKRSGRGSGDGPGAHEPIFPCVDRVGDPRNNRCNTKFPTIGYLSRHLEGALHDWHVCWTCFSDEFRSLQELARHRRYDGCRPRCLNALCRNFDQIPLPGESCFCKPKAWEQWIKLFKMRWPDLDPPAFAIAGVAEQTRDSEASRPLGGRRTPRTDRASLPPVPLFHHVDATQTLNAQNNSLPPSESAASDVFSFKDSPFEFTSVDGWGHSFSPAQSAQGNIFDSAPAGPSSGSQPSPQSQSFGQSQWSEQPAQSTIASSIEDRPPDQELAEIRQQVTQGQQMLTKQAKLQGEQAEDEPSPMEVVLGLVFQHLIDARVPSAFPGSALYKQVKLVAPRVIADAHYPPGPSLTGIASASDHSMEGYPNCRLYFGHQLLHERPHIRTNIEPPVDDVAVDPSDPAL